MKGLISDTKERARFARFAFVGFVGALVDFAVANLLIWLTGTSILYAGTVSFICAVINNFLWNRYWTYPDSRAKKVTRQLIQFGLVSIIGLGVRAALLYFIEEPLIALASRIFPNGLVIPPDVLAKNLALVIAILIVLLWNFFANRYWTYNDIDDTHG